MLTRARERARRRPLRAAFARIFVAGFASSMALGTVLPVLPQYVTGPLGSGSVAVGIVIGAFAVSAIIARPIAGRLADRRGRRAVILTGMLTMAGAGALYFLPLDVPGLVVARLVLGVGEAFVFTAGLTWTVDMAPPSRRAQAIGLWGLSIWTALSAGPVVGEVLRSELGYDAVWAFVTVTPLVGLLVAWTVRERHTPPEPGPRKPLIPRESVRPGLALALANVGWAALAGFSVLLLDDRGIAHGAVVFTAFATAVVLTRLVLGRLPDRLGAGRTAVGAGMAEAAGLAIIAVAPTLAVAVAGALMMGLGFSTIYPSLALLVVDDGDEERRGAALGAFTAFFDLGVGIGAPLAGVVAAVAGYPAVFWFGAAAAAGTVAVAAGLARGRPTPRAAA